MYFFVFPESSYAFLLENMEPRDFKKISNKASKFPVLKISWHAGKFNDVLVENVSDMMWLQPWLKFFLMSSENEVLYLQRRYEETQHLCIRMCSTNKYFVTYELQWMSAVACCCFLKRFISAAQSFVWENVNLK